MPQFALVREATDAFNVCRIEQDDFEADDLIATYAREAVDGGRHGHHRLLRQGSDAARHRQASQLCDPMQASGRSAPPRCARNSASGPDKVIDVQALCGDSDRQRAGRARHRRQDRGRAHQHLRRSRNPADAGGRDQAAQAPPDRCSTIAEQARISKRLVTLDDRRAAAAPAGRARGQAARPATS